MINEIIEDKTKLLIILKWLLVIVALGFLLHFPDLIGHSIIWIVHTIYEATSFILEEFLSHVFGLDKALAQLIVFYFSIIVGTGASVLFWQRFLRNFLLLKFYAFQHQVIDYWHNHRALKKMKLILIYSALTISGFMFLLS